MDLLKLIPQLFYDLISRVVPGALAIAIMPAAANVSIGGLLTGTLPHASPLRQSNLFLGLVFFVAAYFIGHLTSPLSDLLHKTLIRKLFPHHFKVLSEAISPGSNYGEKIRQFLASELGPQKEGEADSILRGRLDTAIFVWQDWLRITSSEAGVRAAKVRAEYRMHAQNAVVLIVGLIWHLSLVAARSLDPNAALIVFALAGTAASMCAAARTYQNFQTMVINQYFSVKNSNRADPGGSV